MAAITLFLLIAGVYGQDQPRSLQLTLKPDKHIYERGDKIKLIVEIENISDKEVCINTFENESKFLIALSNKEKQFDLTGLPWESLDRSTREKDIVCIKPKKKYRKDISNYLNHYVLVNENNPIKSGIIDIHVEYSLENHALAEVPPVFMGTLVSNPITIVVEEKRKGENDFKKKYLKELKAVDDYMFRITSKK